MRPLATSKIGFFIVPPKGFLGWFVADGLLRDVVGGKKNPFSQRVAE